VWVASVDAMYSTRSKVLRAKRFPHQATPKCYVFIITITPQPYIIKNYKSRVLLLTTYIPILL